jgi:glycogen operon protein
MRLRLMRSFLATLAFSQGVPMLSHGDELGRTQKGNNNAYAQDNDLTWLDWDLGATRKGLLEFTRKLFAIRQAHPVLRRRHFFKGAVLEGSPHKDVTWIQSDGKEIQERDWGNPDMRALGMLIDGAATDEVDERGHAVCGDTLLMLLNGGEQDVTFALPALGEEKIWVILVDTAKDEIPVVHEQSVVVQAHALVLLRYGADRRLVTSEDARREPLSAVDRHTP